MSLWIFLAATAASTQAGAAQVPLPPPPSEALSLPTPTPDPATEIVEGQRDYYRRMTVPVTIEGEGPFQFMIDTGSQATVVTRGLTERLGLLPIGTATLVAMGSREDVLLFELNGLEFAERVFDDISAPMLESRNVGADGILGLDSLQDLRVMIDFRNDTIAVNDSAELGGNRGYEIIVRARHKLGRLIITSAKIDGVNTAVVVDTGAQVSFGNAKLQRRLRARNNQEVKSMDVNGVEITGHRHIVKSLRIQQLQLNDLPITFADSPAFAALGLDDKPALILGMRDLRLFDRVAIDFATRRILFDVPSGTANQGLMQNSYIPSRL